MQSSGRVCRTKGQKKHHVWNDDFIEVKAKQKQSQRQPSDIKRDLEEHFERKRLKQLVEDSWN